MAVPEIDDRIDWLYQLPLEEFTAARNALAKETKRPDVKTLEKPNVAAWAVNQLYWRHRADYDRLIKAAERLHAEHRKLLGGRSADVRGTEAAHRDAIRAAAERVRQLLHEGGHALSDQTLTAVQETLEALPSAGAAGRLTRPLKPMGFEALAGVAIASATKPALRIVPAEKREDPPAPRDARRERDLARQREKEERERKQRQRQAEKELKAAEAAMLRAEEAVNDAEKALAELRAKRDHAVSEYQRARLRAHQ